MEMKLYLWYLNLFAVWRRHTPFDSQCAQIGSAAPDSLFEIFPVPVPIPVPVLVPVPVPVPDCVCSQNVNQIGQYARSEMQIVMQFSSGICSVCLDPRHWAPKPFIPMEY
eukprot:sb/3477255/